MNECDIGMLSTVLIGNSNTFVKHGLMVTPRGYANKYAVEDGERNTHDGEQAGRSLSTGLNGWMASIQGGSGQLAVERLPNWLLLTEVPVRITPAGRLHRRRDVLGDRAIFALRKDDGRPSINEHHHATLFLILQRRHSGSIMSARPR
jgi:hypothetical protein